MNKIIKRVSLVALAFCMAASLAISTAAYSTVRYGSRGSDVKTLQTMLNEVSDADLSVDGIFGSATKKAVRDYQRQEGLTVDGIAGKKTWAALCADYEDVISTDDDKAESRFASTPSNVVTYSLKKDGNTYITENFRIKEFKCNDGSDSILIDQKLAALLQDIRDYFGKPVYINSAYRTTSYNKKIGGATRSYHISGKAADIYIKGVSPAKIAAYCESIGVKGIGLYSTFVHVDTRTSKYYWKTHDEISVSSFR